MKTDEASIVALGKGKKRACKGKKSKTKGLKVVSFNNLFDSMV